MSNILMYAYVICSSYIVEYVKTHFAIIIYLEHKILNYPKQKIIFFYN